MNVRNEYYSGDVLIGEFFQRDVEGDGLWEGRLVIYRAMYPNLIKTFVT